MDVTGTGYEDICNLDSTKIFNSLKDKARTAKAANHKLPGKLSSNVRMTNRTDRTNRKTGQTN